MLIPLLKENGKYSLIESNDYSKRKRKEYDYVSFFHEGFAKAKISDQWIYIDLNENVLPLKHNYENIQDFILGSAAVERDGLWYLINKNGIEITKRGYKELYRTHKNFIEVVIEGKYGIDMEKIHYGDYENASFVSEYHCGLIDTNGFEILAPEKQTFYIEDNFICISIEKCYHGIDFNGKKIFTTYEYKYISSFYKNRAIAIKGKKEEILIIDNNLNEIKYIGTTNEFKLGECYILHDKTESGFINGLHTLKNLKKNKWGYINTEGEIICDFIYDYLEPYFYNNLSIAGLLAQGVMKYALLDSKQNAVTPFKYDTLYTYSGDYTAFEINGKWGLINDRYIEVIPAQFTKIGECTDGTVWVSYGDYKGQEYYGRYGLYYKNGNKICPVVYDSIPDYNGAIAIVQLNNKYGLVNKEGWEVAPIIYDDLIKVNDDFYLAKKSNLLFVIDKNGKEIREEKLYNDLLF